MNDEKKSDSGESQKKNPMKNEKKSPMNKKRNPMSFFKKNIKNPLFFLKIR